MDAMLFMLTCGAAWTAILVLIVACDCLSFPLTIRVRCRGAKASTTVLVGEPFALGLGPCLDALLLVNRGQAERHGPRMTRVRRVPRSSTANIRAFARPSKAFVTVE